MSRPDSNANRFQLEPLEARLLFSGDTIYVTPIGDSITYGTAALYQAGYRGPLEDLLQSAGQGHAFTGTLDNLPHGNYSGLTHRGHFAIPGGDTIDLHNALTTNYGAGASTFDALRSQGTSPDFVLLHLGTNNFDYGLTTDDATAAAQLDDLLAYMHGPEGIDAGTKILLARIIPRAYGSATWDAADKAALLNIAQYNYNQMPALDAAYGNSIVPVDMFRIDATTLTTLTPQEMALANTDGDAYVDWIVNYNESNPLNQSNINATTGRNTALFNDSEHPTALGYKIMAEVWSKALLAASEPPPVGQPISVGDLGKGLFAKDNATGGGYILYSQQNVHERFDHPWLSNTSYTPDLAQNLIVVKLIDGTWHIDGNVGDYQAFTPTSTDVLIAAVDFDNDTVTDLKGTDGTVAGITAGYALGDLTFVADQWDNKANNGEFQVFGSYFQLTEDTTPDPDPDPDPTPQPISVGDLGKGLFAKDNATGGGYILYSQQNVHERFDHPWLSNTSYTPDLAQNLIVVKLIDGTWHIDGNVGDYQAFTPTSTDVLIAAVDFDNDTVTDLKGTDGTVAGITAGYAVGDLTFVADQWDNQANNGEFQVFGSYFQLTEDTTPDPDPDPDPDPVPTPQPIAVGNLGKGLFGNDGATGSGYILYSQQNVHQRFNHPWLSNSSYTPDLAQNLIVVKLINGVWHIDGNDGTYQAFTPISTDVLIASTNFDNDTVTDLKGTSGTIAGIAAGYASGDLTFVANQWGDKANTGEFQVYGSTFTPNA